MIIVSLLTYAACCKVIIEGIKTLRADANRIVTVKKGSDLK